MIEALTRYISFFYLYCKNVSVVKIQSMFEGTSEVYTLASRIFSNLGSTTPPLFEWKKYVFSYRLKTCTYSISVICSPLPIKYKWWYQQKEASCVNVKLASLVLVKSNLIPLSMKLLSSIYFCFFFQTQGYQVHHVVMDSDRLVTVQRVASPVDCSAGPSSVSSMSHQETLTPQPTHAILTPVPVRHFNYHDFDCAI